MKQFRITENGFIKIKDSKGTRMYHYLKDCELIWIEAGYTQV